MKKNRRHNDSGNAPTSTDRGRLADYFSFSNIVAVVALLVSCASVVLTSPLIIDYYQRPSLEITCYEPEFREKNVTSHFKILNTGRTAATNIRMMLRCLPHDEHSIVPSGDYGVTEPRAIDTAIFEDGLVMVTRTVAADRIPAKGSIFINIFSEREEFLAAMQKLQNNTSVLAKYMIVPDLASLDYDQGSAETNKQRVRPTLTDSGVVVY